MDGDGTGGHDWPQAAVKRTARYYALLRITTRYNFHAQSRKRLRPCRSDFSASLHAMQAAAMRTSTCRNDGSLLPGKLQRCAENLLRTLILRVSGRKGSEGSPKGFCVCVCVCAFERQCDYMSYFGMYDSSCQTGKCPSHPTLFDIEFPATQPKRTDARCGVSSLFCRPLSLSPHRFSLGSFTTEALVALPEALADKTKGKYGVLILYYVQPTRVAIITLQV